MNTYEVLLQRDNGLNKTVIVNDCMYEDEARLLAESQYGLPVSRVLWKGTTDNGAFYNANQTQQYYHTPNPFAFLSLLAVGGVILILVEFWYLFLIGGLGYASYRVYNEKK